MTLACKLYRRLHRGSRATDDVVWSNSSAKVRRAVCTYCRMTVATSSAAWRETKASINQRQVHADACSRAYVSKVLRMFVQGTLGTVHEQAVALWTVEDGGALY